MPRLPGRLLRILRLPSPPCRNTPVTKGSTAGLGSPPAPRRVRFGYRRGSTAILTGTLVRRRCRGASAAASEGEHDEGRALGHRREPSRRAAGVRAADRAGVHSLWTIDYYNRSSLARAAAFAAVSENSIVGTSVTPLFARSPLALASAAADIQAIAGGRFVLGVGSSTRRMNQDWYGTALQHPAPQVREWIELIRRLIAHRSGPFRYEGRFDRFSWHTTTHHVARQRPILAAGVGEHMSAWPGMRGRVRRAHDRVGRLPARHRSSAAGDGRGPGGPGHGPRADDDADRRLGQRRSACRAPGCRGPGGFLRHAEGLRRALPGR